MANQRSGDKKMLTLWVDKRLAELVSEVAAADGLDRTGLTVAFYRWYVGEDGAELPTPAGRGGAN
jgi:hypothetical protein